MKRRRQAVGVVRWLETSAGQQVKRAMLRRMGETPEQRLRWVVDFARRDLDTLRPEERTALGHDLRWIAYWSLPDAVGVRTSLSDPREPLPDRRLREYQRQIAEGLRGLLAEGGHHRPWKLPSRPVLARAGDQAFGFVLVFEGEERADIIGGVANLILLQAGKRLHACLYCKAPFVSKENRQRYCTPTCSQRMRNRRRKPRPRKGDHT